MNGNSFLMRFIANLVSKSLRKNRASGEVQGVFQHDQPGLRTVIHARSNALFDLLPGDYAIFPIDRAGLASGESCQRGRFKIDDMGTLFADHFLPMVRVVFDGDLVAHSAGGNKDGGFPRENLRCPLFQAVHGGIFAITIVTNLSFGHGAAHLRRWLGNRVAAQIDGHYRIVLLWGGAFEFSQFGWHNNYLESTVLAGS